MKKLLLLLLLSLGLIGISYADDSQEAIEREIAEFEAELAAELALEEATIEAIRARLLAQEKTICHPPQGVEQKIAELKAAAKAEAIARLEAEQAALEAELAAQEMMAEIEAIERVIAEFKELIKAKLAVQEAIDREIAEEDKTVLKDNCSETIKKRVRAEEYLSESQSFIELKNYLIDVSLQNAVQQVIGVDISNFQSLSRSSEDGVENENFSETSTSTLTSKTKGTIDSYEIISTEIIDLDTVKILSLEVEAYVCVKDN
jgi:hypothetical protein